jgi:RNA polymerase sigma-70 factor (ECF subfamily)
MSGAEKYIILTDQQLVDMSIDGDSVAFEHLFNRYRDSILQIYLQRTGGRADDADDLLQETFIKIYLNLEKYNADYTFGQWAYTIARNTFIDYMRKKQDNLSIDNLQNMRLPTPPSSLPTPEESFINSQKRAQIENFMDKMPSRYRKLIELRYFKDYSYEEMAAECGLPLGTVKTQIHRARAMLCKAITDNDV